MYMSLHSVTSLSPLVSVSSGHLHQTRMVSIGKAAGVKLILQGQLTVTIRSTT